ncbi:DUF4176 domain-containing protein [Enterococcus sp. AZ109]|uniref:DUF4176 domain-containing protein n=1 Tax=Enterococcus sp. AZ109 TaxID=2774634 RepID=UPI003F211EC6
MEIYSIGTIVTLYDAEQELMITSRYPLYNNNGEIGYFEYAACLYPQGQVDEKNFFFNHEDIETVHFEGYISDEEEKLRKDLEEQVPNIKYPRITVKDTYK